MAKKLTPFQAQKKKYLSSLKRLLKGGRLTEVEYSEAVGFVTQAKRSKTLNNVKPSSFGKIYKEQKRVERKILKAEKIITKLEQEKDVLFTDAEKERIRADIHSNKDVQLTPSKIAKEYGQVIDRQTGELNRVTGRLAPKPSAPRIDYYDVVYQSFLQSIASGKKESFKIMKGWADVMVARFGQAEFAKMLNQAYNEGFAITFEILYDGTQTEEFLSRLVNYFANAGYIGRLEQDEILDALGEIEYYTEYDDDLYNEVHKQYRLAQIEKK